MKNFLKCKKRIFIFALAITTAVSCFAIFIFTNDSEVSAEITSHIVTVPARKTLSRGLANGSQNLTPDPEKICAKGFKNEKFSNIQKLCKTWKKHKALGWNLAVGWIEPRDDKAWARDLAEFNARVALSRNVLQQLNLKGSVPVQLIRSIPLIYAGQNDGSILVLVGQEKTHFEQSIKLTRKRHNKSKAQTEATHCTDCDQLQDNPQSQIGAHALKQKLIRMMRERENKQ